MICFPLLSLLLPLLLDSYQESVSIPNASAGLKSCSCSRFIFAAGECCCFVDNRKNAMQVGHKITHFWGVWESWWSLLESQGLLLCSGAPGYAEGPSALIRAAIKLPL